MRFTISIVAFNGLEHVRRCVQSVFDAGTAKDEAELILTDNGSTDGTGAYFDEVARIHAHVHVRHYPKNLGFQIPHKLAFADARGELFVLLNSDTQVPAGWLFALAAPFATDPMLAATAPMGGCNRIQHDFRGTGGEVTEYLEGACLCVKTEIVRKVGLFAPYLYFAYGEDSDLSLRLRERGYNIQTVPIVVHHIGQATSMFVPEAREAEKVNHAALRQRWRGYLRNRDFSAPTLVRRVGGAFGDVLLMTPILAALRRERPQSILYVDATPCNEVLAGNPNVGVLCSGSIPTHETQIIDLVGAYEKRPGMHIVDAYALEAGVGQYDRNTEFHAYAPMPGFARGSHRPNCVAMHIGPSHWPGKNWPEDRWRKVIAALGMSGWSIVLVGNQTGERIESVWQDMRGRTLLVGELATVISACDLFIGLDSFPLHLAQAVGTPVVGLFGCTRPDLILTNSSRAVGVAGTSPCAGDLHRVARSKYVPCDGACMNSITPDRVIDAVKQLT